MHISKLSFLFACICHVAVAQNPKDSVLQTVQLLPATVAAIQHPERAPFPTQNIDAVALAKRDGSMDMPFLLRFTPSLVVTSDAGAGVGYTAMRIRGSDQTHINVTLNGVALNDAESHQVYWVDLPDLSSSVDDLTIQRGVGSSSNGPGAFGATVSLRTMNFDEKAGGRMLVSAGSFNTRRSLLQWSTGKLGKGWYMEGRVSRIVSDGYMDRSGSDLSGLQLGIGQDWKSGHMAYTAILGHERTQQAWYGVPRIGLNGSESEILAWAANSYEYGYGSDTERIEDLIERGRRHNYYRYANQVDDYRQDHHQFLLSQCWNQWDFGATLHYTSGAGYYEQFREDDPFELYGAGPLGLSDSSIVSGQVIRRRWLDNDFIGGLLQGNRSAERGNLQFGLGAFDYGGEHFGQPIWMEFGASNLNPQHRYYDNKGEKSDRYGFVGGDLFGDNGDWSLRGELQVRQVGYTVTGTDNDLRTLSVDTTMTFVNPRLGFDFVLNAQSRFFASLARGSREPVRNDFIDRAEAAYPRAEHLTDFELGWEISTSEWSMQAVVYSMHYRDQLVLTGALNDVGSPIRRNVPESYRTGVEWINEWRPKNGIQWYSSVTVSANRITDFGDAQRAASAISYSPGFTATSVVSWEFLNRVNSSGSGSTCDVEWAARHVGKQFLDNTASEIRSLPAYSVHDLRIRWMKHRDDAGYIALSGHIRNVLNAQYASNGWSYFYEWEGSEISEVYVYPQAGAHGMITLEVSF